MRAAFAPACAAIAAAIAAALAAACTPAPRHEVAGHGVAAPVCRAGPDGGPVSGPLVAERGIGGTGAPVTQVAERGIGGTGIIGVVTGFASLCLAGHEIALPADAAVEIGGAAADQQALRAGHVAVVQADGPADALTARRIAVRYEVEGPVEAASPERLQVAGQTVLLSAGTWLRAAPAPGQWVAVSGLRDPAGAIAATRVDLVSTRTLRLHGVLQQEGGRYRIGALPIEPGPGDVLAPGLPVSLTGVYDDGAVRAAAIAPDLLAADPVAYFGRDTSAFIVEGFGRADDGGRYLGALPFGPALGSSRRLDGRSVFEFRRPSGGRIRFDSVVPAAAGERFQPVPPRAERGFEPAPMPNRSLGAGAPSGGAGTGGRPGDAGRDGGRGAGPGRQPGGGGGRR